MHRRQRLRATSQRQRRSRARSQLDLLVLPCAPHDVEQVVLDGLSDVDLLHRRDQCGDTLRLHRRGQIDQRVLAAKALQHGALVLSLRVADVGAEEKAVELRFRQGEGPFQLDRVLGGDDQEWARQRMGLAFDRDLPLFHRFQQRRLGTWTGAVDLVGQHHVGEDRARVKLELAGALAEDQRAADVGGKQVGRELDAVK